MARMMRVLSPLLVIAIVLSLVAGVIAVSSQTALALGEYGNTTLTVVISSPADGQEWPVGQYFWVDADIDNTGENPADNVSVLLIVSPVTACSTYSPNPVTLLEVGAWAGVSWNLQCQGAGDATITVVVTADNAPEVRDSVTVHQEDGSITTPRGLKEDAIELLEAAKTGDCWLDKKIDKIIWFIERSLDESLWVDDSHLKPCHGTLVFVMEKVAVLHMQCNWQCNSEMKKIPDSVKDAFQEAILCLVNADEALAQIAIEDAKASQGDEHKIMMAEESLAKAYEELAQGSPDKAITRFAQAWGHAQVAMGLRQLCGETCEPPACPLGNGNCDGCNCGGDDDDNGKGNGKGNGNDNGKGNGKGK